MKGFNFEIKDIIDICNSLAKSCEKDAEEYRKIGTDYSIGFQDGASTAYKQIGEMLKKELLEAAKQENTLSEL